MMPATPTNAAPPHDDARRCHDEVQRHLEQIDRAVEGMVSSINTLRVAVRKAEDASEEALQMGHLIRQSMLTRLTQVEGLVNDLRILIT
jgi:hypothetical protein